MATVTRGKTFISGETVEPADMHQLVDSATVTDIVNADIKSDAAIAGTKIAPNFGSQNVVTTGTLSCRAATFITGSPDRIGTDFTSNAISTLNFGSPNSGEGNFQLQYNRSAGTFAILGGNTGSQTERMRIDASGNVGIGTNSPTNFGASFRTIEIKGASGADGGYVIATTADGVCTAQVAANGTTGFIGTRTNHPTALITNNTERVRFKTTGQVRFVPLASDPAGAEAGDVYYNSATNKLKVYNGTSWLNLH